MPNTFLTPDIIARQAYANLYAQTVMAQLVWRDYEADFRGQVGDTVTIRKPATFEAEEYDRQNGITVQTATETGVPVVLDTLLDVSFAVTTEQLTLDIVSFNEQLIAPATEALVQAVDKKILTLRSDVTNTVPINETKPPLTIVAAGKELNDNNVPMSNRHLVADTALTADLVGDQLFHEAHRRGDTEGLQEASIGRKFGFDNWMTQNIEDGESVAFHETAFALVARTLAIPRGASNAAVFGGRGFGIRVVMDYDIDKKQDVVSLDCLIGVKTLDADRATLVVEGS